MSASAYIGIGSNLGDREFNLLRGVAEIGKLADTRVTGLSGFYETEPVGSVPQGDFYNAVLRVETELAPLDLLRELQRIESGVFRRIRTVPGGPRSIDLDILLYGDEVLVTEGLVIPHPRLHERRFVLEPLAELAPALLHPLLGRTVAELLRGLESREKVRRIP